MKYRTWVIIVLFFAIPNFAYPFDFIVTSVNPYNANDIVELGIYDSQGRYSGYDINNPNEFSTKAPYFRASAFTPSEDVDNLTAPIQHSISARTPLGTTGTYKLAIYGQKLDKY